MSDSSIQASEFAKRRQDLAEMVGPNGVAIIPGASLQTRNSDVHFPFRQDSDFWYLTGFDEPDALLVLAPGREQGEAVLFCRDRDPERERWDGPRAGLEGAISRYGFDDAFPFSDADEVVPGLMEGREKVYCNLGKQLAFDQRVITWMNRLHQGHRKVAHPPEQLAALGHTLHEQRLIKSSAEIKAMRRSAQLAAAAHRRLMAVCRPGMTEAQLNAELLHEFHSQGSETSYLPIVGGGNNACILHYIDNNQALRDGDLVLVDAGCEVEKYASDITRTFPVNGRFSSPQQALYEVVLAAQIAAIEKAQAGQPWLAGHEAAVNVIAQGLIDLGLLQGDVSECIESGTYRQFFMHKTGHWLGLDVHDVGDYTVDGASRELEPGMVLTIEPGIYVPADCMDVDERWRGIGIRIEDDVAVTRAQADVLSADVPKTIQEIEALMTPSKAA